jgi:hypothetical protein
MSNFLSSESFSLFFCLLPTQADGRGRIEGKKRRHRTKVGFPEINSIYMYTERVIVLSYYRPDLKLSFRCLAIYSGHTSTFYLQILPQPSSVHFK